jgi:tricorn protease-like protein
MTLLYVSVSEGGAKIIKHNLNTGEESVVDKTGVVSYDLSPDGQKVVCSNDSIIKIVPLSGGEPKELIRGLSKYYSLKWTTDSHNIIARLLDESNAIWKIPVDGGPSLKLDLSVPNLLFFALHPDNRNFMYSTRDKPRIELWVLENFLPK